MPVFLTAYTAGNGTYGGYIEAESRDHAGILATQRGLGERIEFETGKPAPPHALLSLISGGRWLEAAHEATFLCCIGLASGALTAREALGDTGLVHGLLHLALWPADTAEERKCRAVLEREVKTMAMDFEWRVPGWVRSYNGQPGVRTYLKGRRTPKRDAGAKVLGDPE